MRSALLYLQWHSMKNRFVTRVKRLKQPKYLIGAIFGGAYFYFYFFRWMFHPRARESAATTSLFGSADSLLLYESVGALVLFVIVLLAWIIPHKRAALTFSEAEIAFLFPAPVTRRTLIHFKLVRSQIRILFSALFFALISRRFSANGSFLIHAVGWWIILSTLNLHFLGSSFAMTKLMDRGVSTWMRRLVVLIIALAIAVVVGIWAKRTLPPLTSRDIEGVSEFLKYAQSVFVSGPMPYLLFPFRLVARPYLAGDAMTFLNALWPALLVLGVNYWWVVRSDVAFEEASVEASQKLAEKVAAVRAGKWQTANQKLKRKRAPFELTPTGFSLVALFWKNLISAGSLFTSRVWIFLTVFVLVMSLSFRGTGSNWASVVGMVAGMVCVWSLLIGPQIVRQDLRQDLQNADLLKGYPMPGWQIVLGEILAPVTILTSVHWLLLILAAALFPQFGRHAISGPLTLAIAVGAAMVLPILNIILLLIPNAAVLLFPAWFQSSREGAHGIEATGQRLVFALGQFFVLIIALVPAVAVFMGIFFLVKLAGGVIPGVLLGAVATILVLAVEAALGIMLLGRWFEHFDVSAEMTT